MYNVCSKGKDLINIQGEGTQEYLTCGIENLGKFCLKSQEPWSLESGIQLKGFAVLLKMSI